jgi:hypothetical protein
MKPNCVILQLERFKRSVGVFYGIFGGLGGSIQATDPLPRCANCEPVALCPE